MVRAINFTLRLSNSPVYQENSVVQAGVTEQDYPVTPLLFTKRNFPVYRHCTKILLIISNPRYWITHLKLLYLLFIH